MSQSPYRNQPGQTGDPTTPTEKGIIDIWAALVGTSALGIGDTFIDVGGDSVTGALFINRARDVFGVEVPFDTLFGDQVTVADLAALIDRMRQKQADDSRTQASGQ